MNFIVKTNKNGTEGFRKHYVVLLVYTSQKIKSNNLEPKLISVFNRFIEDVEKLIKEGVVFLKSVSERISP